MTLTLDNMTQERWAEMSERERNEARDASSLTAQLDGLEGWRVEVETMYGETRRFYVGRSTGWRPIHLEVKRRDSMGGFPAETEYAAVRKLYRR